MSFSFALLSLVKDADLPCRIRGRFVVVDEDDERPDDGVAAGGAAVVEER